MVEHEDHTFPEEREPSGRLILGPCLECDMPAMEGLSYLIAELAGERKDLARAWQEGVNVGMRLKKRATRYSNPYREGADRG